MSIAVEYVKPTDELLQHVADNMREADAIECMASSGRSPLDALTSGVVISNHCSVVMVGGVPCAVVGLVITSLVSGHGVPWMLATDDAVKHRRVFIDNCKQGLCDMLKVCPNLVNYVHAENKLSVKWLRWMGFTILPSEPTGVNGAHFHKFYIGEC